MTAGVTAPSGKLESQATAGLAPVSSSSSPEIAAKPEAIAPPKPLESSPAPPAGAAPTPPAAWIDSPTVSPPPAAAISLEAPLVSSYLMNGNLLFERGDIASARLFFQEAANAGSVQAMVAVGKTYDPNILSQLGIRGFSPDPVKAAEWYVKANQAGDSESAERKFSLTAGKRESIKIILPIFQYVRKARWATYLHLMSNYRRTSQGVKTLVVRFAGAGRN
jgi:TPR repeat protein